MIKLTDQELTTARSLIRAALAEDLQDVGDLTCQAVLPEGIEATVNVVARTSGRLASVPIAEAVFEEMPGEVTWSSRLRDGDALTNGTVIASITGPVQLLLSGERTALNFLTHLSGIASLTHQFVTAVEGTQATILDTRKTLPGYRQLQKYAVRCGGGTNHRMGLFDAILIKDNHLAFLREADRAIPDVLKSARSFARRHGDVTVEVEVDTLDQLAAALLAAPDIVLLDNMTPEMLRTAVQMRDDSGNAVQLEASGGVNLATVRSIAETGVDRISVGALTHSAPNLDIAFDWPG